jgi:hypothetical protein
MGSGYDNPSMRVFVMGMAMTISSDKENLGMLDALESA